MLIVSDAKIVSDDSADTSNRTMTLFPGSIGGSMVNSAVIGFVAPEGIEIRAGSGDDVFDISARWIGTAVGIAILAGGGGGDLNSSDGDMTIDLSGGSGNALRVGGVAGSGRLVLGDVTVSADPGAKVALTYDGSDATANDELTLDVDGLRVVGTADGVDMSIDFASAMLSSIFLRTGSGVDTLAIRSVGAGGSIMADLQSDFSNVEIGDGGDAQGILGAVDVKAEVGGFAAVLDDSADGIGRAVTVDADRVSGLLTFGPGLSTLSLRSGTGADEFAVLSTRDGVITSIVAGDGADTIAVKGTGVGGVLAIDAEGGVNQVDLGAVAGVGARVIQAPVSIHAEGGTFHLNVDETGDLVARNVVVNVNNLSGSAM